MNRSVISFITTWILESLQWRNKSFTSFPLGLTLWKTFVSFIASAIDWKPKTEYIFFLFWALLLSLWKEKKTAWLLLLSNCSNNKHQNIHILSLVFSPRVKQWKKTLFFWSCGFFPYSFSDIRPDMLVEFKVRKNSGKCN